MSTEAERDPEEHIHPDDPRYDGFRITQLWLATVIGPDNQEGVLGVDMQDARRFHMNEGAAFAADERRLAHLREFAAAISKRWDIEVRVRHFVPRDEVI